MCMARTGWSARSPRGVTQVTGVHQKAEAFERHRVETAERGAGMPLEIAQGMRKTLLSLVFLAACSGSGRSTLDASGAGDAVDDGQHGDVCGGFAHTPCSATEFCDYSHNGDRK